MNKNNKIIFFILAISLLLFCIVTHCYLLAILLASVFYIAHAILFTDHIYYDPGMDYQFNFDSADLFKGAVQGNQFSLIDSLPEDIDTCVLPIHIQSSWLGSIFDPYLTLTANGISSRQYVERGTNGKRFLNLSRFSERLKQANGAIEISASYCSIIADNLVLFGFRNPDYCSERVLIVSPHADDAELAAFGFYKNTAEVLITTISAGEVDAKPLEVLAGQNNTKAAGLLKGLLRAWDSLAVPLWGGRHVEAVQLGYFCMTLKAMYEQPDKAIPSLTIGEAYTKPFRVFNKRALPSDNSGENTWKNLVSDLTAIISEYQPDVILTPHPTIDPQSDHYYSTRATLVACEAAQVAPTFLLYANHYQNTDMYPFGPEHSDLPLPPHFENDFVTEKLYSFPLSDADQIDKVCALQMMHDLNRPTSFKKQLRRFLQRLIGRSKMPYGNDEYLRKAIRQQELFWVTSTSTLKREFKL